MPTLSPRRKCLDHLSDYRSCAERCSYRSNKLPVQNKTLLRVSARRLKVAIWVVWPNPNPVPPHNLHEYNHHNKRQLKKPSPFTAQMKCGDDPAINESGHAHRDHCKFLNPPNPHKSTRGTNQPPERQPASKPVHREAPNRALNRIRRIN